MDSHYTLADETVDDDQRNPKNGGPAASLTKHAAKPVTGSPKDFAAFIDEHQKIIEQLRKNTKSLEDDDWGRK